MLHDLQHKSLMLNLLTLLHLDTHPLMAHGKKTHNKQNKKPKHKQTNKYIKRQWWFSSTFVPLMFNLAFGKAKLHRNHIPGAPAHVAALLRQHAGNGRLQWDFLWQHLTEAWIMKGFINHLQNCCSCGFIGIRDSWWSLLLLIPLTACYLCLARSRCPYEGEGLIRERVEVLQPTAQTLWHLCLGLQTTALVQVQISYEPKGRCTLQITEGNIFLKKIKINKQNSCLKI